MNRQIAQGLLPAIGLLLATGCAGYDRILFATKTNIGLDIDDKPPTAELTIARRELAITPTFQDAQGVEKTLPLLASFGLTGNFLDPEITSRFAGGRAAVVLAQGPNREPGDPGDSSLCLNKEPDTRSWVKRKWQSFAGRSREDTRAFYFATDTAFGIKVAWDGTTGPYPSTLKLGYNRKELAFPPIFSTEDPSCPSSERALHEQRWRVTVPSFVASLDNSSTIKERFESGMTHIQFFATGQAASDFVSRPEVNAALNTAMYHHTKLSIDPMIATVTVAGRQTFHVRNGTGPITFSLMQDGTGGATIEASTGVYTAGPHKGRSIIGATDEAGKTAVATVTVISP